MWFSERAFVFVDARNTALAVYRRAPGTPTLLRFASERISEGGEPSSFSEMLRRSAPAVARLGRELKAPGRDACLVLPVGSAFPSIVETHAVAAAGTGDVDAADMARFRLAPLLPFPVAHAEVRVEESPSIGRNNVLAQAVLKTSVGESEAFMAERGFPAARVTSALSAVLRGLAPNPDTVDLILGDAAYAIAVRNGHGVIEAIHLRLLIAGDDRARRSIDEAFRAAPSGATIRVTGERVDAFPVDASPLPIRAAFTGMLPGGADPQRFPFLGVFDPGRAS
jgi:hypothetical protein